MKQSGNTTQNANLQEFLDSAANAADYGQRQFYTPPSIAAALFRPLPALARKLTTDLHFGNGALARASGAEVCLGLDIDARVKAELEPPQDSKWEVTQADLTHWYPIAHEAGLQLPYITINPPFSLRWYSDRLTALADSSLPEVAAAYKAHPQHIDSTLASFLIALDRLLPNGEGFMVCNASTARRFFGNPDTGHESRVTGEDVSHPSSSSPINPSTRDSPKATHALMKFIWLWLEIPGKIFDNQQTEFDTAVLYFSRSHGATGHGSRVNTSSTHDSSTHDSSRPLFLTAPAADTRAIEQTLMVPEVFQAHHGARFRYDYEFAPFQRIERFRTVASEYAERHHGKRPDWNIAIDDKGRLKTHLTPFQNVSRKIPPALAAKLHAISGQTPVAMCVTATTRTALREAVECGVWRIHPAVHTAIASAMVEFDAQGAPFFTPTSIQSLGWVDEYSTLTCQQSGIGSALPGDACPIACSVEPTAWKGNKINLAGEKEDLEFRGKELLVKLTDPAGVHHYFHVRRDEADTAPELGAGGRITAQHWHIADLITHFAIPTPKDITALQPDRYQANLAMMQRLQTRVRENLAAV